MQQSPNAAGANVQQGLDPIGALQTLADHQGNAANEQNVVMQGQEPNPPNLASNRKSNSIFFHKVLQYLIISRSPNLKSTPWSTDEHAGHAY